MSRPRTKRAAASARDEKKRDPVPLSPQDLLAIVRDPEEIRKGTFLLDDGRVSHLARFENRIFAEARGAAPSPYRVAIAFFEEPEGVRVRPKCTCPAARARPVCKHAAALLVAWARTPTAFATAAAPPLGAPGERRRGLARGKAAASALMAEGVEQIETLARELAVAGVAVADTARARMVRTLGESLREYRLRRISARALDVADLLDAAAAKSGALDPLAYADLIVDLVLTSRKLARHVAGEPLEDRHVEELVGKTWRANERAKIEGLDLVEYAYGVTTTSDDFIIRESRFVDLATGDHFSEKQIVPVMMSRMTPPKPSRAGVVHQGARASLYPGYAPRRIEITDLGDARSVDDEALARLENKSIQSVGAALDGLRAHRRDVFAPDRFPVALRASAIVARGDRLEVVDADGRTLQLPASADLEARLAEALRDGELAVLLGDVGVATALPTLFPLAVVVRGPSGATLESFTGERARRRGKAVPSRAIGWADAARAAGASEATIALGEVREELAVGLVDGLASFGRRVGEPLASRLTELGLAPQAAIATALVARVDPFDRVDDFVRLYQVLTTALLRLASALVVDRAALVRAPAFASVLVAAPSERLDPAAIEASLAAGKLNPYEASAHEAAWFEGLGDDAIWQGADALAADGAASPFVERVVRARGDEGVARALEWLAADGARVAKITALRVLAGSTDARAVDAIRELATGEDPGLGAHARAAEEARVIAEGDGGAAEVSAERSKRAQRLSRLVEDLELARSAGERSAFARALLGLRDLRAVAALRRLFAADPSREVRLEAASALAFLGHAELTPDLLRALADRADEPRAAGDAARVLGLLGDARAARALAVALAEGFKPATLKESMFALGPATVAALAEVTRDRPDIAQRAAVRAVFAAFGVTPPGERPRRRKAAHD